MAEPNDRASLFQKDHLAVPQGPVECLGMTFASEDARRSHFLERLKEKLPELSQRHDFPLGEDEDILRLSDPPYYTACPNPFLTDFVTFHGRPYDPDEPYSREPFAVDVSVGKTDPLYRAHGYHTKVPHLAIVPSILHYTKPGDIVLDGFCGSGMTGVAAQWCGTGPLAEYRRELEQRWKQEGREPPEWGSRRAILGDLSPAATFNRRQLQHPLRCRCVHNRRAASYSTRWKNEIGWMYETLHTDGKTKGTDQLHGVERGVLVPGMRRGDLVSRRGARSSETKRTRSRFPCPHCSAELGKDNLQRSFETRVDPASGAPWQRIRLRPALINYSVGNSRYEKEPDQTDLSILERIGDLPLPSSIPTNAFPIEDMYHGSRLAPKGFMNVHHMFLPRAAHALAAMWQPYSLLHADYRLRNTLILFFVEQSNHRNVTF